MIGTHCEYDDLAYDKEYFVWRFGNQSFIEKGIRKETRFSIVFSGFLDVVIGVKYIPAVHLVNIRGLLDQV